MNPKAPDLWASFIFPSTSSKPGTQKQGRIPWALKEPFRKQVLLGKAEPYAEPSAKPRGPRKEAKPSNWAAEEALGRQRQIEFSELKVSQGSTVRWLKSNSKGYLKEKRGSL